MRLVLLAAVLASACAPPAEDDVVPLEPDAAVGTSCDLGGFEIAAPRPDLHYAPSMVVYVDESELQGELTLTMTDNLGNAYAWTSDDSEPYPGDAGTWWSRDSFHYDLAPSRRYTLTVSHCQHSQTVTFFTSSS